MTNIFCPLVQTMNAFVEIFLVFHSFYKPLNYFNIVTFD